MISRAPRLASGFLAIALAACGLAGIGDGEEVGGKPGVNQGDGSTPDRPGASSGSPSNTSSSGGSSGATPPEDGGADVEPGACVHDLSNADCPGNADFTCQGSATEVGDHFRLTQGEVQVGALWMRVDPSTMHDFSVEFDVEVMANTDTPDVGNGFAFVFAGESPGEPFPRIGAALSQPTLGAANLESGTGTAVFWRSLRVGDAWQGGFLSGVTQIPSSDATRVDQWSDAGGTDAWFDGSQGVVVRVRVEHHASDGAKATATFGMSHDGAVFQPLAENTRSFDLPASIHYVGVTANTGHPNLAPNSTHAVRAMNVHCTFQPP